MKSNILVLSATAVILGGLMMIPKTAEAYKGDHKVKGPNYTTERHEAMEKAFEKKDYNAWKNLIQGKGRVTQIVNKDNFAKFVQAHELAEQGKFEEANKIRQQLGLGLQNGLGKGMGFNRK